MIRVLEMRESVKILQQALRGISSGPIIDPKAKLRGFRPKAGEAYGRIEAPKGELGFYLISDGSPNPYRLPRAPAELHRPAWFLRLICAPWASPVARGLFPQCGTLC